MSVAWPAKSNDKAFIWQWLTVGVNERRARILRGQRFSRWYELFEAIRSRR
jgi:hypothetical protein